MLSASELVVVLVVPATVLGLAIGSFLNVVIHRLPLGLSLSHPGSRCPSCATPIRARHNVPVLGWLLLRGRCYACRAPIEARYPLVEAGTALAFAGVTAALLAATRAERIPTQVPAWLWLTACLVAAGLIEWDGHRVPSRLAMLCPAVLAVLLAATGPVSGDVTGLVRAGVGGLVLAGSSAVLRRGRSDLVGIAAAAGLALGAVSWSALIVGAVSGVVALALPLSQPPVTVRIAVGALAGLAVVVATGY